MYQHYGNMNGHTKKCNQSLWKKYKQKTLGDNLFLLLLFLDFHDLILAHGRHDDDRVGLFTGILEHVSDFTGKVIRKFGESDIFTGVTICIHEGDETIVRDIQQGELFAGDEWDISVVGGRDDIFVLLASENIDGGEVALGVTVLASLGGGHVSHLHQI